MLNGHLKIYLTKFNDITELLQKEIIVNVSI